MTIRKKNGGVGKVWGGLAPVRTSTRRDWHMCGRAHLRTAQVRTGTYIVFLYRFRMFICLVFIIFTGFPAGTVQIREHQQLQQKISKPSVLVASQMDINSYHFDRFKVPWETSWKQIHVLRSEVLRSLRLLLLLLLLLLLYFIAVYLLFVFLTFINVTINNNDDNDDNNGGIAAHCCGIFSCTNPPVWPVGVGVLL